MPHYEMRLSIGKLISDICQDTISKRPIVVSVGGNGTIIKLEFDPDINSSERTQVLNALPAWIKQMYKFSREQGALQPEV